MPEPSAADELDAAERYVLAEVVEDIVPLYELAPLAYVWAGRSETRVVGPGADIDDAAERLRVAKHAAQALLTKGLVEVETGPDWLEEGELLTGDAAARALLDDANWSWPTHGMFVWLVPTRAGEAAAERLPPDPGRLIPSRWAQAVERLRRALARVRG